MKLVKKNAFRVVMALVLSLAVYGCNGDTGASGPGNNNGAGGDSGGDTGDGASGGTSDAKGGETGSGGSMKRCFDDEQCPEDEYYQKDDPSDDSSVGACVPGCRPGAEDPSGEGRICDRVT